VKIEGDFEFVFGELFRIRGMLREMNQVKVALKAVGLH
jgi:hypothetical protein